MKDVIEDGHLLDLISKVEKLERLINALPSALNLNSLELGKREGLYARLKVARGEVKDRWMQLENMDW